MYLLKPPSVEEETVEGAEKSNKILLEDNSDKFCRRFFLNPGNTSFGFPQGEICNYFKKFVYNVKKIEAAQPRAGLKKTTVSLRQAKQAVDV